MTDLRERRGAARVPISGHVDSRVRATLDARLLDLSITGARIAHEDLLRPGLVCVLELPATLGSLSLSVRVVRSSVVGTEKNEAGERILQYESGLAFLRMTGEQRAVLLRMLEELTPQSNLGNGRLLL